MSYATEHIASTLKAARESKGLSQRELSKKVGVPQGHISKIENGAVDLRVSSLVALARVLDLELTLVSRKALSAVKSIVRSSAQGTPPEGDAVRQGLKELKRLQDTIASVIQVHPAVNELVQLQRQVREIQRFQTAVPDIEALRAANKAVTAFREHTRGLDALRQTLSQIKSLRNALAHSSVNLPELETVRPAYSLDEDDHG